MYRLKNGLGEDDTLRLAGRDRARSQLWPHGHHGMREVKVSVGILKVLHVRCAVVMGSRQCIAIDVRVMVVPVQRRAGLVPDEQQNEQPPHEPHAPSRRAGRRR